MVHVTSKTILRHQVNFSVSYKGEWWATIINQDKSESVLAHAQPTLGAAVRVARAELKKEQVRVAVPFTHIIRTHDEMPKLVSALAKGRHALRKHEILIWFDDGSEKGKTDTLSTYWSSKQVLRPDLRPTALNGIKYLFNERHKTQQRLKTIEGRIKKWEQRHSFDLLTAVDEAIKQAQEGKEP